MDILYNTAKSKLVTDNPELLRVLHDKYAFYVPGYNYVPSYKKRQWDGKKRYFKLNGEFRSGILHRILDDLKKIGAEPTIIDHGPFPPSPRRVVNLKKYKYRDYQREAVEYVLQHRRCIIDSPTGSGKTLIIAGIVKSLAPRKMVIMFREKGILTQTYEFLKECGIESLGINFGEGYIYGDIMLTTVQSVEKILDTHLDEAEVLIIDEAHQFCKGETVVAAIEAFPNAIYRAAFTATVPSEKKDIHGRLTLEGAFGKVYVTKSTDDLIKDGSLAKPIIQIAEYSPSGDFSDMSYQEIYEDHIVNSEERNSKIKSIVSLIEQNNNNAKILILVKNLKHLQKLKELIPNSFTIEGSDDITNRYDIIQNFVNSEKTSTLIGTNVMQTGISINEISHMINARGLEGEIPTIQGLGRGLRKADGKDTLYFYDFYDDVPYLDKHSKGRIKHYKNLKFEINYVRIK